MKVFNVKLALQIAVVVSVGFITLAIVLVAGI